MVDCTQAIYQLIKLLPNGIKISLIQLSKFLNDSKEQPLIDKKFNILVIYGKLSEYSIEIIKKIVRYIVNEGYLIKHAEIIAYNIVEIIQLGNEPLLDQSQRELRVRNNQK